MAEAASPVALLVISVVFCASLVLGEVEVAGLVWFSTCAGEEGRFPPAAGSLEEEDLCPTFRPSGFWISEAVGIAVVCSVWSTPDYLLPCRFYPEVGEFQDVFGSDIAEDSPLRLLTFGLSSALYPGWLLA